MGVASSNFGQIFLRTDKPIYYAGENVTGCIYLSMVIPFPGTQVCIKLKGSESTYWTETESESYKDHDGTMKTRSKTVYRTGFNEFFRHRIPVYTFPGVGINPGQYTFPFAFVLPDNLPGSFAFGGPLNDPRARISYEIKASIDSGQFGVGEMKSKQELVIREPIKENIRAVQGEMNANITTWCCIPQGNCTIKGYFDKNVYAPGDTATMVCEVDNTHGKLAIKDITFKLKQHITMRDNLGRTKVLTTDCLVQRYPGMGPGENAMNENRRNMQVTLIKSDGGQMQPSTSGNKVSCQYVLEIQANVDGCTCCKTLPHVDNPVRLFAPQNANYAMNVTYPSDWNPQTMPTMNFVLNDGYRYQGKRKDDGQGLNVNISFK